MSRTYKHIGVTQETFGATYRLLECSDCGAAITDEAVHNKWHESASAKWAVSIREVRAAVRILAGQSDWRDGER